jgi:hypothetical protein
MFADGREGRPRFSPHPIEVLFGPAGPPTIADEPARAEPRTSRRFPDVIVRDRRLVDVQIQGDTDPSPANIRETGIAQVMTSTSIGEHPTALYSTGLPILQIALNVDAMSVLLRPILSSLGDGNGAATVRYAKLIAYKQGNRGLISYETALNGDEPSRVVMGKLFPSPDRAERVLDVMEDLSAIYAPHPSLSVPLPLGCVPELGMLVYIPVPGRYLDEAIKDGRSGLMDLVALWLRVLSTSGLRPDRRLDTSMELVNAHGWAALIEHRYPQESTRAHHILKRLRDVAPSLPLRSDAVVHKDFHYRHVLVDQGVGVIDFDEVRVGDPMLDVAHFCAHLRLLGCRDEEGRTDMFDRLEREFIQAYADRGDWEPDNRWAFFYAYTCLKIAKQLCTTRGVRPRPEGEEAQRQVNAMLEGGVRAIAGP